MAGHAHAMMRRQRKRRLVQIEIPATVHLTADEMRQLSDCLATEMVARHESGVGLAQQEEADYAVLSLDEVDDVDDSHPGGSVLLIERLLGYIHILDQATISASRGIVMAADAGRLAVLLRARCHGEAGESGTGGQ